MANDGGVVFNGITRPVLVVDVTQIQHSSHLTGSASRELNPDPRRLICMIVD